MRYNMSSLADAIREGAKAVGVHNYADAEAHYMRAVSLGDVESKQIIKELVAKRKITSKACRSLKEKIIYRVSSVLRVRTRYSSKLDAAEFKTDTCAICMNSYSTITMLPCNHRCLCIGCTAKLLKMSNQCVLCNTFIINIRLWD
jgi:hypothetical protein